VNNNNFVYLLVALLILLFGIPLAQDLAVASGPLIRSLMFSLLLVIGIWSLRDGGRFFTIGMAFVVAGLVLNLLAASIDSQLLYFGSLAAISGFLLVAIVFTLKQVVFGTEISFNRLVGAVCVYLLLGTIWALAYTLVDAVSPGSFTGFSLQEGRVWDSDWLYFSFVTMTTLGYGDISPVSATARALAYMQAVFGQFYIAILVAGLVSGYISRRQTERDSS
jgi:voltage-gated potassium channel